MSDRVITGARFAVDMGGDDQYVVRVNQRDYIAWDRTAPRHKWGTSQEVPFLFSTFLAWSAARREGRTALHFDAFCDVVENVDPVRHDEQEDVIRPTQPAPTPTSSSSSP